MSVLRRLSFGEIATGVWGLAWISGGSGAPAAAVALGEAGWSGAVSCHADGTADADWLISGDGLELRISPAGEPAAPGGPGGQPSGAFEQLCRVSGGMLLAGAELEIDCRGHRACGPDIADLGGLDSLRFIDSWFPTGPGFALLALRPAGALGQEADAVSAAVLEPASPASPDNVPAPVPASSGSPPANGDPGVSRTVSDPRLSTTYAPDGSPSRAGLELWLVDPEGEQFPRRAAGEALGPSLTLEAGQLGLHVALFSWHANGQDGCGVYGIGRPR